MSPLSCPSSEVYSWAGVCPSYQGWHHWGEDYKMTSLSSLCISSLIQDSRLVLTTILVMSGRGGVRELIPAEVPCLGEEAGESGPRLYCPPPSPLWMPYCTLFALPAKKEEPKWPLKTPCSFLGPEDGTGLLMDGLILWELPPAHSEEPTRLWCKKELQFCMAPWESVSNNRTSPCRI